MSSSDSNSPPILAAAAGGFLPWLSAGLPAGRCGSGTRRRGTGLGRFGLSRLPSLSSPRGARSNSSAGAMAGGCGWETSAAARVHQARHDQGYLVPGPKQILAWKGVRCGRFWPGTAAFSLAAARSRSAWEAVICWPWTSHREIRTASGGSEIAGFRVGRPARLRRKRDPFLPGVAETDRRKACRAIRLRESTSGDRTPLGGINRIIIVPWRRFVKERVSGRN